RAAATSASEKLFVAPRPGEEGPPAPATYDRLPLDWNKSTVKRFKDTLAARDIQAFLVRDPLNIMYLTGYWHTTTERPQAAFMNKDDADPWFMYPGLDRDSVTTWWFGGGRPYVYFDRAHGFARDYILTHGTDVTDYEVGQATTTWINDILYSELDLKNGAIHHGVASAIGVGCRVGPLTAFPHPNQPLFNRIGRN